MTQKPTPLPPCVPHAPLYCKTSTALALPAIPHLHKKPAEPAPSCLDARVFGEWCLRSPSPDIGCLNAHAGDAYVRAEFAWKLASCGGALPLAGSRAGGTAGLRVAGQVVKNNEKQKSGRKG